MPKLVLVRIEFDWCGDIGIEEFAIGLGYNDASAQFEARFKYWNAIWCHQIFMDYGYVSGWLHMLPVIREVSNVFDDGTVIKGKY
jgi:hypothetical protein